MARGRRPGESVIVPMKGDGDPGANLAERALARAAELRPEGMLESERWIYDRLAPPLCNPTRPRLNEANVFMFQMLCRTIARYERLALVLDDEGETYETKGGRNGNQKRSRPEAAQLNAVFAQIRALANDFGMTPAGERAIGAAAQLGFNFDDDDDFN